MAPAFLSGSGGSTNLEGDLVRGGWHGPLRSRAEGDTGMASLPAIVGTPTGFNRFRAASPARMRECGVVAEDVRKRALTLLEENHA